MDYCLDFGLLSTRKKWMNDVDDDEHEDVERKVNEPRFTKELKSNHLSCSKVAERDWSVTRFVSISIQSNAKSTSFLLEGGKNYEIEWTNKKHTNQTNSESRWKKKSRQIYPS